MTHSFRRLQRAAMTLMELLIVVAILALMAMLAVPVAAIPAAIAFAMQSTLGNLLGGISLQLDNTCRIGDWIRMDGVTGRVVGIRWRYTSIATNTGARSTIPTAAPTRSP